MKTKAKSCVEASGKQSDQKCFAICCLFSYIFITFY